MESQASVPPQTPRDRTDDRVVSGVSTEDPTAALHSQALQSETISSCTDAAWLSARQCLLFGLGAVILSVFFAAFRSVATGWVPIGDSAYFTSRSLDVGGAESPLLGAWSSGSIDYAEPVNSLGPLQLYLLAPFTILHPSAGTAIGVAAVQVAAVACLVWLLWKGLGARSALAALVGVAWVVWAMGSENQIAAVQHPYLVLPFATAVVATIATILGVRSGLPILVFFGSLCAQTHLSYPILIAALLVLAGVGYWRAAMAQPSGPQRRDRWTTLAWSVALGIVLWLPPIIDQIWGRHNLTAALTQRGGSDNPTGFTLGVRLLASVLTAPTTFGPNGFHYVNYEYGIANSARGAAVLVGAVGLVVIGLWAWRRGHRMFAAWAGVLAVVLVAMIVDAALIPGLKLPGRDVTYRVDNYRWLWAWLGLLIAGMWVAIDRALEAFESTRPVWRRWGGAVMLGIIVILSLWNLVPRGAPDMSAYERGTDDVAELQAELDTYLDEHDLDGPVVIDDSALYLGSPHNYPVVTVAHQHGLDYRFVQPQYGYRYGDHRLADGSERYVLKIWVREEARTRQDSLIAYADSLEPAGIELIEVNPVDSRRQPALAAGREASSR